MKDVREPLKNYTSVMKHRVVLWIYTPNNTVREREEPRYENASEIEPKYLGCKVREIHFDMDGTAIVRVEKG